MYKHEIDHPVIMFFDEDGIAYNANSRLAPYFELDYLIEVKNKLSNCINIYIQNKYTDEYIYNLNKEHSERLFKEFELERVKSKKNKTERYTEGYIYLMKDNRNGYIKIGYSKKPEYREKTLQSDLPDIEMIFNIKAKFCIEKELHDKFKHLRLRGEWFNLREIDICNIKAYLTDGTSF